MKGRLIFAALLCGALCLALPGCSGGKESSAAPTPRPATTAQPTKAPTAAPTPTATPTAAPTASPSPSPTPQASFDTIFDSGNVIRERMQEDLDMAASASAIARAYGEASHRWQNMIGIAYYDALSALSQEDAAALEAEQAQWESEIQGKIDDVYARAEQEYGDGSGETSAEGRIWAASQVCALYEERARALCQIKFEADGVMPDLSQTLTNTEAMG